MQLQHNFHSPMRRSLVVQVYDPVVQWASAALQADFEISDSIFGTQQPEKAAQAVGRYLEGVGPCTIPSVKLMDIRTSKLGSEQVHGCRPFCMAACGHRATHRHMQIRHCGSGSV